MNDDEAVSKAAGLAQLLLDSGLAFDKCDRTPGRGFRGRNWKRREKPYIGSYSYEEARELWLKPTKALSDAIRDQLVVHHEKFQPLRGKPKASFYSGKAWLSLRYQVLSERGGRCECCGASAKDGAKMQVDHIKPRSKYPELALVKDNLQVLCRACNMGKSNRHEHDWRQSCLGRPYALSRIPRVPALPVLAYTPQVIGIYGFIVWYPAIVVDSVVLIDKNAKPVVVRQVTRRSRNGKQK